jgi:hypothetical protein
LRGEAVTGMSRRLPSFLAIDPVHLSPLVACAFSAALLVPCGGNDDNSATFATLDGKQPLVIAHRQREPQ